MANSRCYWAIAYWDVGTDAKIQQICSTKVLKIWLNILHHKFKMIHVNVSIFEGEPSSKNIIMEVEIYTYIFLLFLVSSHT